MTKAALVIRLSGALLQASDAVQRQFKDEPAGCQLPSALVGPDEFFPAVADSPVGAYANGFGTHALHEDAEIKATCNFEHYNKIYSLETPYRATLQSELTQKEHYFSQEIDNALKILQADSTTSCHMLFAKISIIIGSTITCQ